MDKYDFRGKRVLVAGGTGLIGIQLVKLLIEKGARVRIVSLDDPSLAHPEAEFIRLDLLDYMDCLFACKDMDYVFNLLCVKGSPAAVKVKPATFFDINLLLDVLLLRAARRFGVEGYLLASSLAVYPPSEIFYEDKVWHEPPSDNDKFAGWAKRMGELQAEAYRIQYDWRRISVVRPANTYGPYDTFTEANAMVVPSLIRRAVDGENPFTVWGDGTSVRDLIHAKDVARGMVMVAEQGIEEPVNLGSGKGFTIKELVEVILANIEPKPEVVWDTSKATGDRVRILDTARARSIGFEPKISLQDGIRETVEWYKENKHRKNLRLNLF